MSQCLAVSCLILYIAAALKHKLRATCTSSEWIRAIHMRGKRLGVRIPKDNQQPCFSNLYLFAVRKVASSPFAVVLAKYRELTTTDPRMNRQQIRRVQATQKPTPRTLPYSTAIP